MAYIAWFDEIGKDDVSRVGGKNASLGEMYRNLSSKGIRVPYGFAVTTEAYKYFIEKAGIKKEIEKLLEGIDAKDVGKLMEAGEKIRKMILNAEMPSELENAILNAYERLEEMYGNEIEVAVRSSATTEDMPTASFAGQQDTFLNVGKNKILESIVKCFSSLFTDRAIAYRIHNNIPHTSAYISVGIQKMVRSDLASSGVMFTLDTESGFRDVIYITGIWGLGEALVKGIVNPDEFYVFKPTLDKYRPVISKKLGRKKKMIVYGSMGGISIKDTDEEMRYLFVLNDDEILELARMGWEIEKHYGMPMDIEWAKDGIDGKIYIVQARPETVHSKKRAFYKHVLLEKGDVLLEGLAIGDKIGAGKARVVENVEEAKDFAEGSILVTDMTDPDWEPIMKKASAIVTNRGGRTCHAAIISRELGIPAVVGTGIATEIIKDGMELTVDCSEGIGRVYKGILKYEKREIDLKKIPTKTKIMMNVAIPEKAFMQSMLPNDGVGL
ncbi:MAG: phosphoenolpyruvate synthase, partial [Thermoplasmata archaeon]|nr:phosphoenolpyruvate synthase [Thermoplasmata archaeon]